MIPTEDKETQTRKFKYAHNEHLSDVPEYFISLFYDLYRGDLTKKSIAEYIKLKYNTLRVLDEEL